MKTLTEMLKVLGYQEDVELAKRVFKEWLKSVGLPDYESKSKYGITFSSTESLRQLLIILVDEP